MGNKKLDAGRQGTASEVGNHHSFKPVLIQHPTPTLQGRKYWKRALCPVRRATRRVLTWSARLEFILTPPLVTRLGPGRRWRRRVRTYHAKLHPSLPSPCTLIAVIRGMELEVHEQAAARATAGRGDAGGPGASGAMAEPRAAVWTLQGLAAAVAKPEPRVPARTAPRRSPAAHSMPRHPANSFNHLARTAAVALRRWYPPPRPVEAHKGGARRGRTESCGLTATRARKSGSAG